MGETVLRIHTFPAGTSFTGEVIGALEQVELSDGGRLLDALFVAREPEHGELQAIDLATGHGDGSVAALLDFRLDPGSRAALTARTLTPHAGGVPATVITSVADGLEPGAAVIAVLLEGDAPALATAVERAGGTLVGDERVAATTLADVADRLPTGP